jgi:hypothetical protein
MCTAKKIAGEKRGQDVEGLNKHTYDEKAETFLIFINYQITAPYRSITITIPYLSLSIPYSSSFLYDTFPLTIDYI